MVRLAPEAFIGQLHKMYKNTKNSGSVCLSFKKYNGAPPKAKKAIASGQYEPCCIVRAVAKKKKISTFIKAEDVVKFQGQLTNVMKVNMDNLKVEQKKKKKKNKKKRDNKNI